MLGRNLLFVLGLLVGATVSCRAEGSSCTGAIAGGISHSLALKSDGTVLAWGYNNHGQLGDGTTSNRYTPVQVSGLSNVGAIASGEFHSLALKSDGTVWAWGDNYNGELGDGSFTNNRYSPVEVSGLSGAVAIAGGVAHSLALKSDGTVWAWGWNAYGQLGDGTAHNNRYTPVQVSGLSGAVAIGAGEIHSVALKSDGTVWAWGSGNDNEGTLGDGTMSNHFTPVQVSSLSGVVTIAVRDYHNLALKSNGTVWAWGRNDHGGLGDGTTTLRRTPVQVSGLSGVVAIAAGLQLSLALKSDGSVSAWGFNQYGELGDGTTTNRYTPVQISGLGRAVTIGAGWYHSLALKSDGTVWACGRNFSGELGDGTTTERDTPVQVSGLNLIGPCAVVTIVAVDANASEPGSNTGFFRVTRTGSTNAALRVNYAVSGTATPGIDYSNLTRHVTIPAGSTNASIRVKPIDDGLPECPETVIATLAPSNTYIVGSVSNATVTISDNDSVVTIVASDPTASETGSDTGRFKIFRTGCTNVSLTVGYRVSGTASNGVDYTRLTGAVTIPVGFTNAAISVKPLDDSLGEGAETVIVTLTNRPAYVVGSPSSAMVTINDNDTASAITYGVSPAKASTTSATRTKPAASTVTTGALVGTWELKVHGGEHGSVFVTFHDDYSLSGYGITRGCLGIWTISGTWETNGEGSVVGKCIAQSDDQTLWEGKLNVQIVAGALLAEIHSENNTLKLRGHPASDQPDLSDEWLAQVESAYHVASETYTLSLFEKHPGVFQLDGEGAGFLRGAVIATSRNVLVAHMEGEAISPRSLVGHVDSSQQTFTLSGFDQHGVSIQIKATRK